MTGEDKSSSNEASGIDVAVGIDIVGIDRFERVVGRWGARFIDRCFTTAEIGECNGRIPSLAARFAAKEAAFKAMGSSPRAISWQDIEIVHSGAGAPALEFHGGAAAETRRLGWKSVSLSLTHDAGVAVAVVIVLKLSGSGS